MKLAEALSIRSDLQKRIAQLKSRLLINARVQEGEEPAENPLELLRDLDELIAELDAITVSINMTNGQTVDDGETITSLLARRDGLVLKVGILRDFLANASATVVRNTKTEIKIKSTIKVSTQQKEVDKVSKDLRQLDARIQALNWTTELK
ncbi:MAG: DIP1984 family protein [Oscillospiraceae bacterium]